MPSLPARPLQRHVRRSPTKPRYALKAKRSSDEDSVNVEIPVASDGVAPNVPESPETTGVAAGLA